MLRPYNHGGSLSGRMQPQAAGVVHNGHSSSIIDDNSFFVETFIIPLAKGWRSRLAFKFKELMSEGTFQCKYGLLKPTDLTTLVLDCQSWAHV